VPKNKDADSTPKAAYSRMFWLAALAAAIILGAIVGFFLRHPASSTPGIRAFINPPPDKQFRLTSDVAGPPVLSPDGSYLAFTANGTDGKTSLWIQPLNAADAHALPDTSDAIFPFWSPDSRSLGFFADGKVRTIELNAATAQTLCDAQLGRGGTWSHSGTIVFSPSPLGSLFQINANGGTRSQLTNLDSSKFSSHRWPTFLPDGNHYLYFAMSHDPAKVSNNGIYYASLDGHENRLLLHSRSNAIFAGGFLLFNRGDQLMAQAFNPAKGELSGEPQTVASGVLNDVSTWHTTASATDNGLLTFGNGTSGAVQLVWMDRDGRQVGIPADNLQNLSFASLSPQGNRVALMLDSGINDIWSLDLARGVKTRLTFGPTGNTFPVWSPDGKWVAYSSLRPTGSGIYRKLADGTGPEELLVSDPESGGILLAPTDWSRVGNTLFYSPSAAITQQMEIVWSVAVDGDRKPHQILSRATNATLSPNGRWLAYSSTESGRVEVYVQAYGGGQGKWQVTPNGGQVPHWSSDGKELYYFDLNQSIVAVSVKENGGALQFGTAQTLINQWTVLTFPFYGVAPDSKRFLMERVSQQVNQHVTLLTNFTSGLKK
jgi:eukaryotic-like serine/threonine-protein kinase